MHLDESTLRWLIGGLIAAILALLGATLRAGRLSKQAEDLIEDVADLVKAVFGDTRESPPIKGLVLDLDQIKNDHETREKILNGLCKALRITSRSNEHEIADAVKRAIAELTFAPQTEESVTGRHRAIGWHESPDLEPLAPPHPASVPRPKNPTPFKGAKPPKRED